MHKENEEKLLEAVLEIRNWIRAASHSSVRTSLEAALPDSRSRMAYQMLDGDASVEEIRITCKMSPNAVVALANRCTSMGLMEVRQDKKRVRLFDLSNFGLIDAAGPAKSGKAT